MIFSKLNLIKLTINLFLPLSRTAFSKCVAIINHHYHLLVFFTALFSALLRPFYTLNDSWAAYENNAIRSNAFSKSLRCDWEEGMKTKEHLFHNLMLYPLTKFFLLFIICLYFSLNLPSRGSEEKSFFRIHAWVVKYAQKFSLQIIIFFFTKNKWWT